VSVHGAVHSAEKGEHLKKLFAKFGDKYEVIVVETEVNPVGTLWIDTASLVHYEVDHPDGVSRFLIRISSAHAY
jgi:hypothetical protein